jgi:dipeptidyl aminopeptidase/acylaminoacyl peptidase
MVYTVQPTKAETEKAKKDKKPVPKAKQSLCTLSNGQSTILENATNIQQFEDNEDWLIVQYPPAENKKDYVIELRNPSQNLLLKLEGVLDFTPVKGAKGIVVAFAQKDGLVWIDLPSGKKTPIENAKGRYFGVTVSEATGDVAFAFEPQVETKDKDKAKESVKNPIVVKVWSKVTGKSPKKESFNLTPLPIELLPKTSEVASQPGLRFSKDGRRLFFGVVPVTPTQTKPAETTEEQAVVDIWHWKDPKVQPEQILDAPSVRNRTYLAVWNLKTHTAYQLATPEMLNIDLLGQGNALLAIGYDDRAYQVEASWGDGGRDVYTVNLDTGEKKLLMKKQLAGFDASPSGRYIAWYDRTLRAYFCIDLEKGTEPKLISQGIPTNLWWEQSDMPGDPIPYGSVGWTVGDKEYWVYDQYDLWALDPQGALKPHGLTEGYGRRWNVLFRRQAMETEENGIDPSKPIILNALDDYTKASGFYQVAAHDNPPIKLRMEDHDFGVPIKAKDANAVVVPRQSFKEYPDLYFTDLSFANLTRQTDANPQQAEYLWGSNEMVDWISDDGLKLRGILYKPANFDPSKKYPMIVEFYQRMSDRLHNYYNPGYIGTAGVNFSVAASRGYLVFTPDIYSTVGYPGRSATSAIVSGVLSLVRRGYVDEKRIAICGHSWGGYETAFLVTQTNLFRCAVAGAAVTNMTSAYSGIRWGSGVLRQFQYERGQSRIGGSLWEKPLQFLENSPVFWADRVQTPIMLLHNDNDGAVPWEQSIEFYGALRRLGKPVWLVNYNGEEHGIGKLPNRKDWTIRIMQFYDYYLQDAPMPVWLRDGVPAVQKGKTFGLGQ